MFHPKVVLFIILKNWIKYYVHTFSTLSTFGKYLANYFTLYLLFSFSLCSSHSCFILSFSDVNPKIVHPVF